MSDSDIDEHNEIHDPNPANEFNGDTDPELIDEDANIEGDDLDDHIEGDYRHIPELDRYDTSELDNNEYSPMSHAARRQIDEQMNTRHVSATERDSRRAQLSPSSNILSDNFDEDMSTAGGVTPRLNMFPDEDEDESGYINLDDFAGPLREWITLVGPRREIRRRFRSVLTEYEREARQPTYAPLIASMCADNRQSLLVSYMDLSQAAPTLGIWLADCPAEMLRLFDEEAYEVVLALFPEYGRVHSSIHVRITNLPVSDQLRDLRQMHLNALVRVAGVVTRRTSVYPQLQLVKYDCNRCSGVLGPLTVHTTGSSNADIPRPARCRHCDSPGPFRINQSETLYRNYQKLTLQESPGSVPAGRVPRTKDVIVCDDLRDCARPGEQIDVTGVYRNSFSSSLNSQHGFPVFITIIDANYVCKTADSDTEARLTDHDRRKIRELAQDSNIAKRIVQSIAPSIYGHDDIKMALALSLFGGEAKHSPNAHRIRGDINVLMLGDPGTAKSQFLKYAEKTSSRSVFTTGKGASAVGLTASVRRDPLTREWTLEGGALVLADTGVCLIDEFDKMNDQDRTSIHEAMEQQSISISKAGIITSLQARCAVIAACNPTRGRYDSSCTFAENVELADPILSRFDILCVVRDTCDPVLDERLATHVIDSHINSHPDANLREQILSNQLSQSTLNDTLIPQALLKKYIAHARATCHPQLINVDQDKISKLYVEMRQQSSIAGGVPIAVRHVESMLRMSEAHAKMHLRDNVRQDDVDLAVRVMLDSFIGAQKFSVMRMLKHKFRKYTNFSRSQDELLLFQLCELMNSANERAQSRRVNESERSVISRLDDESVEQLDLSVSQHSIQVSLTEFELVASRNEIFNVKPFFKSSLFKEKFILRNDMITIKSVGE